MERSFQEVQYFAWWVYALVIGVGIVVVASTGGRWVPFVVLVILAAIVVFFLRLETVIEQEHLTIRFGWFPVLQKHILLRDIERAEVCSYRPLREFGGWGWRYGPGGMQAFTAKGTSGVCLKMRDGKHYLIGSERGKELSQVLQQRSIAP